MDGNHAVYDVSSDEDVGFEWSATEDCDTGMDSKELFVNLEGDAGNNKNCDKGYESDEVVLVGEVLPKPKRRKKSSTSAKLVDQNHDDDCVVLDGDPNKPAADKDSDPDSYGDSDDLVIVAEKGQVACRDYPHPRHLCVKFPFDSMQHSDYCKLCHCYVCDSPAPCSFWGNGNLMIDHCHANEKEDLWKSERKRAKLEKSASAVSSSGTSFWRDLLQQIQAPAPPLAPNCSSHGRFPGQAPSFGLPNMIRTQRSARVSQRYGFHSNFPSRQQFNPCSNISQRARGSSLDYATPTSIFKRTGQPVVKDSSVPSRASNISFNNFGQAYPDNLVGIRSASKQANSVRPACNMHVGYLDGAVNSSTFENSSAINSMTSQMCSTSIPSSQGQAHRYSQPTAYANSNPALQLNGNQHGDVAAQITSTTHSFPSQASQAFLEGASHVQPGQQLPLTEEKTSYAMISDFLNLEVESSFLNELSTFDFEDEHLDYDMDQLSPLF